MIFKNWLLINENIEKNFDNWLEAIINHGKTKFGEAELLKDLLGKTNYYMSPTQGMEWFNYNFGVQKDRIINVLRKKNIENLNWLAFSLGYLCKKNFFEEDLELAIDVTRRRISSGDLPKNEIGQKGWMVIGAESIEKVREYLRQQQELSNRQKLKLKKSGDTLEEDSNLIKTLIKEKDITIYFLPSLNIHPENEDAKSRLESRKRILCKYGKGTDWCTANPSGDYDRYYMNNDIYIVHEKDQPKYQFTGCNAQMVAGASSHPQFMDKEDRNVEKISLELQEILDKHLLKQTSCYHFKVDFPDLESYIKSPVRDKASTENLIDLTADKKINELSSQEIKDFLSSINVVDVKSSKIKFLVENLSSENFNLLTDDQILKIIQKLQSFDYDELSKKLNKDRLEKVLDSYDNNNLSRNTNYHSYLLEKTASRKKAIRYILNSGINLFYSLKILEYLIKNINIGSQEASTIFDIIISLIVKSSNEKLIFGPGITQTLNEFAKIFGKDNINKIDLNKLQDRMKIDLVPDGDKFIIKFDKKESFESIKYYLLKFLAKYNDKIKGIVHYKKLAGGVIIDDPINIGYGGNL